MSQRISPVGLTIVKAFESCLSPIKERPGFFRPYVDPVGVLTIGWGHTNHHEPKFDALTVWSQKQCDDALTRDMAIFEAHVNAMVKVTLTQDEFDALVSWSYNTGGPASATLWRKLNAGDKGSIPRELDKWNRGGGKVLNGLTRRRKAEGELFAGYRADAFKTAQVKFTTTIAAKSTEPPKPPPITSTSPQQQPPSKWAAFFMALANAFKRT